MGLLDAQKIPSVIQNENSVGKPVDESPFVESVKRKEMTELTSNMARLTQNIDNRFDALIKEVNVSFQPGVIRSGLEQRIRNFQEKLIIALQKED